MQSFSGRLADARRCFDEAGYVVIAGVLDPHTDLQPVVDEYSALLDRLADEWVRDGTLSSYDPRQPFRERLLHVQRETHGRYQGHFDITLNPFLNDPPAFREDSPMHTGPAVFGLLRNPRLLDAMEAFVGPEIYSAPIQHVRVKPPEEILPEKERTALTGQSFWHQDLAVINEEADDTDIVGAFIAISEVTEENGCVLVIPGSHRRGLVHHCRTPTANGIPDRFVDGEPVPVPLKPGDVLVLHRMTFHASLPNRSDGLRWSADLRYCPAGQPTGREFFPGFVARSKADPDSELSSYEAWADAWRQARTRLAGAAMPGYTRWNPANAPQCPECSTEAAP